MDLGNWGDEKVSSGRVELEMAMRHPWRDVKVAVRLIYISLSWRYSKLQICSSEIYHHIDGIICGTG